MCVIIYNLCILPNDHHIKSSYRNICGIVHSERCVCVCVCVYCCVPWPWPPSWHMKLPCQQIPLPKAADVEKDGAGVPQPSPHLPASVLTPLHWWVKEKPLLTLTVDEVRTLKTLLSLQEGTSHMECCYNLCLWLRTFLSATVSKLILWNKKDLDQTVHRSLIQNSPNLETTATSINRQMNKQTIIIRLWNTIQQWKGMNYQCVQQNGWIWKCSRWTKEAFTIGFHF